MLAFFDNCISRGTERFFQLNLVPQVYNMYEKVEYQYSFALLFAISLTPSKTEVFIECKFFSFVFLAGERSKMSDHRYCCCMFSNGDSLSHMPVCVLPQTLFVLHSFILLTFLLICSFGILEQKESRALLIHSFHPFWKLQSIVYKQLLKMI